MPSNPVSERPARSSPEAWASARGGKRDGSHVQKQAPTLGRQMIMFVFALSCFGLLLFLWLAFGGDQSVCPAEIRALSAGK